MKRKERFNNWWWGIGLIILIIGFTEFSQSIPPDIYEYNFLGFKIGPLGFADMNLFFYILKFKVTILFICLFWFITNQYWWRFSIIVPLIIECFKLFELLYGNEYIDETNYIDSLPFTLPLISFVVFLLWRDYQIRKVQGVKVTLDEEIDVLISNYYSEDILNEIEMQYRNLLKQKNLLTKQNYQIELMALKQKLQSVHK